MDRAQALTVPEFDVHQSPNVTARVNGSALLTCRIRNVGSRQVSWGRSLELLTTGQIVFAGDGRFEPLHQPHSEDWALRVLAVQPQDAGRYFCQVSTTPPVTHFIHLSVVEPRVEIIGGPELYIDRGSRANLTCVITKAHKVPKHVRWTHDNKLVQFDRARDGVNVKISYERDRTISFFSIDRVLPSDSGAYFCDPDGLSQVKVILHVLNGEHPAAMQTGGVGQAAAPVLLLLSAIINLYSACFAV
ncbi:hemicentin-2-like isoform X2 [Amphibalanus amphitrite]|uniref:hemicentin-2-like isoform X2 n=1 Tax=Amphibalanus amphitrite TaxID=1232801 RepID=UPI001C901A60|nr:hemicentin-2-like isoform X2 [Amphibalanus amphitrite]XP_043232254.1 hemicentin-2-like isoform X2 [Amphibalanus amphitrite]